GAVGGVGPGAGRIDRERTIGSGGAGLGVEGRRAVDVADGQRAAGRDVSGAVGLGQIGGGRRQHGGVVGAQDVDGDGGVGAVGAGDVKAVGIGGASDELVVGAVGGVGPGAGRIDRERTISSGGAGLGVEGRRAVDVADGQRAAGRDVSGAVGLGQIGGGRRQHGGVVGAQDVDGDGGVGARSEG